MYHYKKKSNYKKIIIEILLVYLITVLFVMFINSYFIQAYKVPTNSMYPLLEVNSRIIVEKLSIGIKAPFTNKNLSKKNINNINRGDIIVFMSKEYFNKPAFSNILKDLIFVLTFSLVDLNNSKNNYDSNLYVKRVIGLPGDKIKFRLIEDKIVVFINDIEESKIILKDYSIVEENKTNSKLINSMVLKDEIVVKENEFYVLGDNRIESSDSRVWGTVSYDQIVGKVLLVYWPFKSFKIIR